MRERKTMRIAMIVASVAFTSGAAADPVSTRNKNWSDLVAYAIAQSSEQNNGAPIFSRECHPAAGTCATYLTFRADNGRLQILSNHQDAGDRSVLRSICQLNQLGDMAHCINFDTGSKHDEIKDPKTGMFVRAP